MLSEQAMIEKLKAALKPSRYAHSLGVVESALTLFRRFPDPESIISEEQVRIAALLHDCAKNVPRGTLLEIADENGFLTGELLTYCPELLHGPVGAVIAEREYGVNDPVILQAIACHTIGSTDMSYLDKLIFFADYIEPGRQFPGVDDLRALAEKNLNEGIIAAMSHTISYVALERGIIHPTTVAARNRMILESQGEV